MATHVPTADEILAGYLQGAFPMDVDGAVGFYTCDPRAVIPLDAFRIPRSVRRGLRGAPFEVRIDTAFPAVVSACGGERHGGRWLSPRLAARYCELHARGVAHSVEIHRDGRLAGGLFGVALGGLFTSESMFHAAPDAGSAALVATWRILRSVGFALWDIQMASDHTVRFGAREIAGDDYARLLDDALALRVRFPGKPPDGPLGE